MRVAVAKRFKLVVVFTKLVFVDLNGVALERAEQLAMEWNGFVAKLVTKCFRFVIPWNDNRNLLVFDELEFLGHGLVLKKKWEFFVSNDIELIHDEFRVPLTLLLVVVFIEVGIHGRSGERIV